MSVAVYVRGTTLSAARTPIDDNPLPPSRALASASALGIKAACCGSERHSPRFGVSEEIVDNRCMRNGAQLITYADRLGQGGIPTISRLLIGPLAGVFTGVHLLPFYTPC